MASSAVMFSSSRISSVFMTPAAESGSKFSRLRSSSESSRVSLPSRTSRCSSSSSSSTSAASSGSISAMIWAATSASRFSSTSTATLPSSSARASAASSVGMWRRAQTCFSRLRFSRWSARSAGWTNSASSPSSRQASGMLMPCPSAIPSSSGIGFAICGRSSAVWIFSCSLMAISSLVCTRAGPLPARRTSPTTRRYHTASW